MFNKNKDKIIGAILAKVQAGPNEKEEKEVESESPEGNDDLEVAAEEMLSAIRSRDVKALAESLKYFIDCAKEQDE